jgi:hypothetical protein
MNRLSCLIGIALPGLLHAQPVPYGLSVDRDHVRIRQPVEVVVNFGAASRWCGLRVDLGDGDVRDILVDDFPLVLRKPYAAAGRYVVRAEGRFVLRGIQSAPGCVGAARALTVVVGEARSNAPGSRPDAATNDEPRTREDRDERDRRRAEAARDRQRRDADLALERGERESEARREAPNPDVGRVPVPAAVPAATPPRVPAAAASRPRDRTLQVF